MNKIFLKGSVTKKESKEGLDTYTIIASTSAIDRQGDSIDQAGWDLENFKANPVLMWAHDYSEFPIGKVTSIEVKDGQLIADFEFASKEANPKAEQAKQLYDGGYLNASSVGLIPKERNGHVITSAELLELSLVPVPANQEALRMAVTSKAVDISLIEADIEKGEVADVLNEQEASEQKWEKWNEVCDVLSALWTVYFDVNTPVEDFSKLLSEAVVLLDNLAGTDGEDTGDSVEMAMKDDKNKSLSSEISKMFVELKSGRTLSKKTLSKIDSSIESMKQSITMLEDLKASSSKDEGGEEGAEAGDENEEKGSKVDEEEVVELSVADFVKTLQSGLRASTKIDQTTLEIVNRFVAKQTKVS